MEPGARFKPCYGSVEALHVAIMAQTSSTAQRVQRRRNKLRAQGMRPIQIWVPDTRAPNFAAEAARQSRLVVEATTEEELDFIDRLAEDVLRGD
jgi:Antitoxin MazE-like